MLKKLLQNKDRKKLVENFFSLSAIQIVNIVLPLITLPYVLRTIGLEKYGSIVFAWSLINYFTSITDFSFKITATRDVSVFRSSKKKLNIIYSKVMIIQSLLQVLSYMIIISVVFLYPPFYENRLIFFLTIPFLFGNTIFPDWFFQGMEQMKFITYINVGVKVFFTIFVFVLIREEADYWWYPLLQSLGFVMSGVLGQYLMIKKYKLKFYWVNKRILKDTFKSNIPIFVNQFMPNLYNNTSAFLLGLLTNNTLLGIYDAIRKVVNLGATLINLISRVFFPFINRKRGAFKKYSLLMTGVGLILAILPVLFYKIILWYLAIDYSQAFSIIAILSVGLFFLAQYDIYGVNYFIVNRKDKLVMKNTIIASSLGFVLAFPLIHYWGIVGAALTITLARVYMGSGLWYSYRRGLTHKFNAQDKVF